jgi:hypothetical protein
VVTAGSGGALHELRREQKALAGPHDLSCYDGCHSFTHRDFSGHFQVGPLGRISLHTPQRAPDPVARREPDHGRLYQIHPESRCRRAGEQRVLRRPGEVGEQDLAFRVQGPTGDQRGRRPDSQVPHP